MMMAEVVDVSLEINELRTVVQNLISDSWGRAPLVEMVPDATDHAASLWQQLTGDLGFVALHLDEAAGGADLGVTATAAVIAEAARQLAPIPLLTGFGLAPTVLATGDLLVPDTLTQIASGQVRTTITPRPVPADAIESNGTTMRGAVGVIPDLPGAAQVLVCVDTEGGIDVWAVAVNAPGVLATPTDVLDPTRPSAQLALDGARASQVAHLSARQWAHAHAVGSLFVASELVAVASHVLATSVEYARTRVQFEQPIGSFQAVKHTLADMHLAVTRADAAVHQAIRIADGADGDLVAATATAIALASESCELATREAIHVHGGIGFTWEHQLHWYRRRAESNAVLVSSPREARAQFATAMGF